MGTYEGVGRRNVVSATQRFDGDPESMAARGDIHVERGLLILRVLNRGGQGLTPAKGPRAQAARRKLLEHAPPMGQ